MNTKYLEIIKGPIITEKSNNLHSENKYTFKVDKRSNKVEIKRALEKIFNVKIIDIKTINVRAKDKKLGRFAGKTASYKKAIVTVAPGQKIELE